MRKILVLILLSSLNLQAAENNIDPVQVEYEKCMALMQKNDVKEATTCFKAIVDISPSSINAIYYLGEMYAQSERYPESIATFKNLLQQQPDDFWAIGKLIKVLQLSKNYDEALKLAEDAHRRFPNHPGFQVALIKEYQRARNLEPIDTLRDELFSLTSKKIYDGLVSNQLYVREVFTVNDATINAIEYFPTESYSRPRYSFRVQFPDKKERIYRLEYDDALKELVEKEAGKGAEPYFVDAYDSEGQSPVTAFNHAPSYEKMRSIVIQDLTQGRKSFYVCIDNATKKPMPCKE